MNGFDLGLLVVLAVFAVTGAMRGFLLETLTLLLWPLAALIAWLIAEPVGGLFAQWISEPHMRKVAGFVVTFLAAFIAGTLIIYLINRMFPMRGVLRAPNMVLGGLVGAGRGAVIIVILFLLAGITSLPQRPWWRDAMLTPYFQAVALTAAQYLPRDIARHIRYG